MRFFEMVPVGLLAMREGCGVGLRGYGLAMEMVGR